MGRISYAWVIIGTLLLAYPGTCYTALQPTSIESARDGNYTYFRVEVPLPADLVQMQGIHSRVTPRHTPRFPLLTANPVHATPCYMETRSAGDWNPIEATNVFYGRTTETGDLKLRLTYPKTGGEWGNEDLLVSMKSASPLPKRPAPNTGNTSSSATLTPAQQFARAQAGIMQLMAYQVPNDAGFFHFAQMQALRAGKIEDLARSAQDSLANTGDRRDRLYETATGARAIQETLQLDRMLGGSETTQPRTLEISKLEGVQTKSHPFDEMLKGKTPKFSEIARLIPGDQYMLRFTSVAKLQVLADFGQRWGHSLLESPEIGGADAGLRERFQKQICLPSTLLSRLLGPAIVKEVAITGSDPYFREGTDITVVFDTVSPDIFKVAVDQYWKSAIAENAGADTQTTTIAGIAVDRIVTLDRSVSAYRAITDNTIIYSNSPVDIQRVLETRNKPESSIASALDFKYMRSVWPQDEQSEDGFLYLSDAFIRRLVGPDSKIKEKRRVEAYASMRSVINAAMLNGYLNGPGKTPSLDEMLESGLLTKSDLAAPDGTVSWNAVNASASNSVYGSSRFLTPLCELVVDKISESEHAEYTRFRDRYQQYWRQFFDPIGVRIKVGKTISFDAYILPLIDETGYQDLKRLTGDKPAKMDLSQVSTGTLVRWQVRLDPESKEIREGRQMVGGMFGRDSALLEWLGEWATVWIEDASVSAGIFEEVLASEIGDREEASSASSPNMNSFFDVPIAAGIEVKNKLSLAGFLVALQGMASTAAPDLVRFIPQPPYKGSTFVKIAPSPGGMIDRELQRAGSQDDETSSGSGTAPDSKSAAAPDYGVFYGTIGNAWYITTQQDVLKRLVDALSSKTGTAREVEYNALLLASPANALKARPVVEKATALFARKMERVKLRQAWLLYRCGLASPGDDITSAAQKWFGGEIALPSGGQISYDPNSDQAISSVYGPMHQMKPADKVEATNPLLGLFDSIAHLRAWLRFTEDGLMTHLELEQM